ncbi:hypothetical protein RN001_011925 [Aquatica leii]|uniref:Uncharacterized protein n=1 Tax=Aquatica leii TaxID=1421715 RepID=A0AAN7SM86_9COLE|nr:hypothetical protein RN001_011925 [Aquatica leii]
MCKELLKEVKSIRAEQIKMGKKLEKNNKEVNEMKEKLRKTTEKWKRKFEEMGEKMGTFEDKLDVWKQKTRLRGTNIYLDDDMTRREIEIQKKIRYEASKMKKEEKSIKIGFLKVWVEDEERFWDEERGTLVKKGAKN